MLSQDELALRIADIPPLPAAILRVMELLGRADVDFRDVEKAVAQDAALTGRLLAVANSSFYGLAGEVGSIKDACVVLGTQAIRSIVMSIGVIGSFPADEHLGLNHKALWKHAIGAGVVAKLLAPMAALDVESAFTAGLLHDVGKVVLDVHFTGDYRQVLDYRDRQSCLLRQAEEALLGFDHSVVGAMLTTSWNLPERVTHAIQAHHRPGIEPEPLVDLLHVADIVCRGLELGNGGDDLIPPLDGEAMTRLGLSIERIATVFEEAEGQFSATISLLE